MIKFNVTNVAVLLGALLLIVVAAGILFLQGPQILERISGIDTTADGTRLDFLGLVLGVPISIVGTLLAIILAYSALKSTDIQTALAATKQFEADIEEFIADQNRFTELYDRFLSAAVGCAETARFFRYIHFSVKGVERRDPNSGLSSVVHDIEFNDEELTAIFLCAFTQQEYFRRNLLAAELELTKFLDEPHGFFWEKAKLGSRKEALNWLSAKRTTELEAACQGRSPFTAQTRDPGSDRKIFMRHLCWGAFTDMPLTADSVGPLSEVNERHQSFNTLVQTISRYRQSVNTRRAAVDFDEAVRELSVYLPHEAPAGIGRVLRASEGCGQADPSPSRHPLSTMTYQYAYQQKGQSAFKGGLANLDLNDWLLDPEDLAADTNAYEARIAVYTRLGDPKHGLNSIKAQFSKMGCNHRVIEATLESPKSKLTFFRSELNLWCRQHPFVIHNVGKPECWGIPLYSQNGDVLEASEVEASLTMANAA